MELELLIFSISSLIVISYFTKKGFDMISLSAAARKTGRHWRFMRGIGYLLMTISALNAFWFFIVVIVPITRMGSNPITRPLALALIVLIDAVSIIGHRYWWKHIVAPAVKDDE